MKKFLIINVMIICAVLALYFNNRGVDQALNQGELEDDYISHIEDINTQNEIDSSQKKKPRIAQKRKEPSDKESIETSEKVSEQREVYLSSLKQLNESLVKVFEFRKEPKEMINFLEDAGLKAIVDKKNSPYLGTTWVVHSDQSLPGTRYYHAEYDGDDADHLFLRYLSYEYAPGDKSFAQVIKSIESSYPVKEKKTIIADGLIHYEMEKDGIPYTLGVKKLNAEDLRNDPIYPHDENDIGAISVKLQLNIEDEHDH